MQIGVPYRDSRLLMHPANRGSRARQACRTACSSRPWETCVSIAFYIMAWLALVLVYATAIALCGLLGRYASRGRPWVWLPCAVTGLAGLAAALTCGEVFGWAGMALILCSTKVLAWNQEGKHVGLVWLKRRLRRRGRALGPFWENVSDYYYWQEKPQLAGQEDIATELEAADAPAGRGTEPEASTAPAGRGDELVGTAQAEGVREGDRLPPHQEHERRPGRT